jgi:hypothetical protein
MVKDVDNVFYEAVNLSLKQKPLRKSTIISSSILKYLK